MAPKFALFTKGSKLPLNKGFKNLSYYSLALSPRDALTHNEPSYALHCLPFYEGRAKSSVTNRLPKFYPRYILKCFTTLEWCVE